MTTLVPPFRSSQALAASHFHGRRKAAALQRLLRLLRLWLDRRTWRKELTALDADQMRDCGFNPVELRLEAAKPFWRA
jgi:uncharacterized protein YjiS (DUF1127 family)